MSESKVVVAEGDAHYSPASIAGNQQTIFTVAEGDQQAARSVGSFVARLQRAKIVH